jgi:hypothetical protein
MSWLTLTLQRTPPDNQTASSAISCFDIITLAE